MSHYIRLIIVYLAISGTIGFQWTGTPKDGEIFYACVGNDVTFPWSYALTPGEEISSIEWLYDGSSQEMVGFLSHGVFAPLPAFSGRVHQTANGSIVLSHVTIGDAGNFTIEVNIRNGSTMKHVIILQVTTGLPTSDGRLHVHQSPDAVLDSTTQQWSLVLTCGHFNFIGHPAFPVEWLTPSGSVVPSTTYKDGYFQLHLTSPVEDGSYTCRVPQQHVAKACLHGNHSSAGETSVVVDGIKARMLLMEAEVRELRHDKQQLQQQVTSLENTLTSERRELAEVKDNFTNQVTRLTSMLHQEINHLGNNLTSVDNRMHAQLTHLQSSLTQMIQDAKTPLVGFNADVTTSHYYVNAPSHVRFNRVLYNAGQGYNSATGDFTAPVSGVYFLIFHTYGSDHQASSYMKANDQVVCYVYIHSDYEHGSCHAVVHLSKGHRVWIEPNGSSRWYFEETSSFAGFLFHTDP